jgi:excisionase family DNA binding protein
MLICEGILFFIGLSMVASGRVKVGQRFIEGQRVRMAGWVLMSPPVIVFVIAMMIAPQYVDSNATLDEIVASLTPLLLFEFAVLVGAISLASWLIGHASNSQQQVPLTPMQMQMKMQMPPEPVFGKVLTLNEAALYLRISEDAVLDLINTGQLPAARFGGEYRIARSAIDDYLTGENETDA